MSTQDCLSSCNLINVMLFWILLILFVLSQEVKVASGEEHNLFPAVENRVGNTSKQLTENDSTVHLYAELIDVLEKLNVLEQSGRAIACYSLEKIVREVIHIDDVGHRILGVYLYFEEKDNKKAKSSVPLGSTKKIMDIAVQSSGTKHYSESDQKYKVKNISYVECTNHSRMGIEGLDSLSRKHDKVNATYSVLKQEDNSVHNQTTIGSSRADREDNNGGLSRTQVVVISTCSAVIGVFFLIAGVMRVRNYLKRYREERMLARRAMQRSISGSLAGTHRRESSASKVSRQGNQILGRSGGVYSPVNDNDSPKLNYSQNSSPSHFVDNKPFLLINAPSSKNGSVTSSHGSIAFIDEDPNKKKSPFTSPDTEDEEDHPLLRKSPDSGNSMDISVPVESEAAIRKPDRNMLGQTPHNIISKDDGLPASAISAPASAISAPESDIKYSLNSSKEHPPQGKSVAKTNGEDSENNNGVMVAADKEQNITSSYSADDNVVDLSKDIDVQTVRDNSVEIDLSHSYSVTTGLTQSDSSLSDNPTYRYGNQMEYTPDFNYENFAYCPTEHAQTRSRHSLLSTNDSFQASGSDSLLDNYNRVGNNSNEPSSSNVPTCDGVICNDNSWEPPILHGASSHQARKTSEGQLVERDSLSALALVDERQRKGLSRRTSLPPRIIPLDEYSERSRGPHSITINKK